MALPSIRVANGHDAAGIWELLESSGLPTADLIASEPQFVIAYDGPRIVATGALQRFGPSALLRSVAVAEDVRGRGLGRQIVGQLERLARFSDITLLILLTQTAKRFFERQGYIVVERDSVPPDVQRSEEFRSLCPGSAVCMAKSIAKA